MTTPPPERDRLTLILAVWGAALGTFTAAWNIVDQILPRREHPFDSRRLHHFLHPKQQTAPAARIRFRRWRGAAWGKATRLS
jgi:hypothetical protein